MRNIFNSVMALIVAGSFGLAGDAYAQNQTGSGLELLLGAPTSTAFGLTTTTTAGVVVLVIVLTNKDDEPDSAEAVKATQVFLRQNSVQLAQDLATGSGPVITELSRAMAMRPESVPAFSSLLRQNRAELVALSDADKMTGARAVAFVRKLVALMKSDAELRADLEALSARAVN